VKRGVVANAAAFQLNWFAVILGAGAGLPWIGVGTSAAFVLVYAFLTRRWAGVLTLVAVCAAIGYAADSALVLGGLLSFPDDAAIGGPSTIWMVGLWAAIACTLHSCMGWLQGRPVLAGVFGLLGGAGSYYAGQRLGAVEFPRGALLGALAVGGLWLVAMPLLAWLAPRLDPVPAASSDAADGGSGEDGGGGDARGSTTGATA
jgi:hypothetical protein